MKHKVFVVFWAGSFWLLLTILLICNQASAQLTNGAPGGTGTNAPVMEQQALDQLKRMSAALAAAQAFTYKSRSSVEAPAKTGQYITLLANSEVSVKRPNKLLVKVTGEVPNFDLYYDGKTVAAFAPSNNVYSVTNAPNSIDGLLKFIDERAGIHFPSADVLESDPYTVLTNGVTSAMVIDQTTVDGAPCIHLALMGNGIFWEIWIETGESAMPRRLALTYAQVRNFPRITVEFSDWNLQPTLDDSMFVFTPPADAKQIPFLPVVKRMEQKSP